MNRLCGIDRERVRALACLRGRQRWMLDGGKVIPAIHGPKPGQRRSQTAPAVAQVVGGKSAYRHGWSCEGLLGSIL